MEVVPLLECPICLQDIVVDAEVVEPAQDDDPCPGHVVRVECCGTTYCRECIDRWIQRPGAKCPTCRQDVVLDGHVLVPPPAPPSATARRTHAVVATVGGSVLVGVSIITFGVLAWEISS